MGTSTSTSTSTSTAAPLKPHWPQPSHPDIQQVLLSGPGGDDGGDSFAARSIARVAVPPFGVYADLSSPPCTLVPAGAPPTYATVQVDADTHLSLNSDLLYINHSCEPSLIFDVGNMQILAGPKGLQPGDELTFFYPSTEWEMAQPFDCLCGSPSCRGRISGARDMSASQLDGLWLSGHIRRLKREQLGEKTKEKEQNGEDGEGEGR